MSESDVRITDIKVRSALIRVRWNDIPPPLCHLSGSAGRRGTTPPGFIGAASSTVGRRQAEGQGHGVESGFDFAPRRLRRRRERAPGGRGADPRSAFEHGLGFAGRGTAVADDRREPLRILLECVGVADRGRERRRVDGGILPSDASRLPL